MPTVQLLRPRTYGGQRHNEGDFLVLPDNDPLLTAEGAEEYFTVVDKTAMSKKTAAALKEAEDTAAALEIARKEEAARLALAAATEAVANETTETAANEGGGTAETPPATVKKN
jgi:hypothetical protein